jgi:CopG family nickel-responsive transcriptional regulator
MKRISIALDDELYRKMEAMMAAMGEVNRSRFIATLVAEKVSETVQAPLASIIVLVYDHEKGEIAKSLAEVQHDYRDMIRASTHIHLTDRLCLEVVHTVGGGDRVRELVSRLSRAGRGLRFLKVVNIPQI